LFLQPASKNIFLGFAILSLSRFYCAPLSDNPENLWHKELEEDEERRKLFGRTQIEK
jgi:hypothetical protein